MDVAWSTDTEHRELVTRLLDTADDMRVIFRRTAGAAALTPTEAVALLELEPDRPAAQRTLAEAMKVDPSNLSGVIDRLEGRGLVTRSPDAADRRVKILALTAAGRRVRSRMRRALDDADPLVALPAHDRAEMLRMFRTLGTPTR